nr:phosphoribosyl transferase domain protein [Colletotrichum truncatum]KAF6794073.1 phosphoribosyl transferase domain protein [Colletotrichum truncatum]
MHSVLEKTEIRIFTTEEDVGEPGSSSDCVVIAGAGCTTGRPRVRDGGCAVPRAGARLWQQGGIGHLARLHWLACDAVVGAVITEGWQSGNDNVAGNTDGNNSGTRRSNPDVTHHRSSFIVENDTAGDEAAKRFAEHHLLPLLHNDRPGIEFRHLLGISQLPSGLALCSFSDAKPLNR